MQARVLHQARSTRPSAAALCGACGGHQNKGQAQEVTGPAKLSASQSFHFVVTRQPERRTALTVTPSEHKQTRKSKRNNTARFVDREAIQPSPNEKRQSPGQ